MQAPGSFHVVVLQKTAKKCTKNYNARALPLFSSLNLFFSTVPVAVGVFLNSLLFTSGKKHQTITTHNTNRYYRVRFYACAGQP